MARLFNAYVTVDWSASSTKKQGADSIWIGVLRRDIRFRPTFEAFNPATRREAETQLRAVLADLKGRNDRALIGFDFALGYPAGTGARLKPKGEAPWSAMWDYLAGAIVDKADNLNNRATVAARMNRAMTDGPRPFWGAPRPADANTMLSKTKPADHLAGLPELREAERRTQGRGKAGAKSVWQLTGNGSVGSQALTGIPAVKRLVDDLGERALVWPFQTGWQALTPAMLADKDAVIAEVYPALVPATPQPGEAPPDRVQVRTLCEHWARLDEAGKLGAAFAAPKDASPERVAEVEGEEGWILGV
ncbi:MAG: cobalamin biosynthesis protein CbiG [Caulobacteraceae bacterium]|nr:cobalamin biosynthesis protein CbiG [Caulobacter sp.]